MATFAASMATLGGASLLPVSAKQQQHSASSFPQRAQTFNISHQTSHPWCFSQRKRDHHLHASNSSAEKAFQSTVEMDKFIDELREADHKKECVAFVLMNFKPFCNAISVLPEGSVPLFKYIFHLQAFFQLPELVAKNVLSFDTTFWMRLAARADLCSSSDDKRDFEELATSIMTLVERVVRKTEEKIESSTDVLKSILKPIMMADEEIVWPPRDPKLIPRMKQELQKKEQQGYLDESFLSEVNAQMRQAKEDGDKPGLVAILQKVLQVYAAQILAKRSYAKKGGQLDKTEEFLELLMSDDQENWEALLRTGMVYGGGQIEPEELYKVINKRIERITMRTESGSYQQRVVLEYLNEIEARAKAQFQAFQSSAT